MHRQIFNVVQTQYPWGNPLRSSPECLDVLLDDSRGCLARCPLTPLPLGTPGTVLCAHSRSPIGLLWVWLGLSFGSWKGKKLEFSDTLAFILKMKKVQCYQRLSQSSKLISLIKEEIGTWK